MTTMTIDGVAAPLEPGEEHYETFVQKRGKRIRRYFQYDYRHTDGDFFSCVGSTLERCRTKRDIWIESKEAKIDG